jgi:hypothetical protein
MSAWSLMAIGFVLMIAGFLVPFLMVLRFIESGFRLGFAAHFSSLLGVCAALYGAFQRFSSTTQDER